MDWWTGIGEVSQFSNTPLLHHSDAPVPSAYGWLVIRDHSTFCDAA